jgi:acetylornithine deacetylase/succinyl-diaminopimelate desuccinylase-like protein
MRPRDQPSVVAAAAELVARLGRLDRELAATVHPVCGAASVFIGQIHSGEIYNQYPQQAWLEGTRRWLPGTDPTTIERDFRDRLELLAADSGTMVDVRWMLIRDAFTLDPADRCVAAFQKCHQAISGAPLPTGPKPFVDDGNSFSALGGVPAITHGPRAGGQHTVSEWVEIDDLVRVAWLYAATAIAFNSSSPIRG